MLSQLRSLDYVFWKMFVFLSLQCMEQRAEGGEIVTWVKEGEDLWSSGCWLIRRHTVQMKCADSYWVWSDYWFVISLASFFLLVSLVEWLEKCFLGVFICWERCALVSPGCPGGTVGILLWLPGVLLAWIKGPVEGAWWQLLALDLQQCFVAALSARVVLSCPIPVGWCTGLSWVRSLSHTKLGLVNCWDSKAVLWHQSSTLHLDMFLLWKLLMLSSMQSWWGIENAVFSSVWRAPFPCRIFISVENWVRKREMDLQLLFCCSTALSDFREGEVCVNLIRSAEE